MKSGNEIERDFYTYVKGSDLMQVLSGEIYRKGTRPVESRNEDVVIAFLSGLDDQEQTGVVIVNAFLNGLSFGKSFVRPTGKIEAVQKELLKLKNTTFAEYYIGGDASSVDTYDEELRQYVVSCRLKFKRISNL